jgi:hypothetical protein
MEEEWESYWSFPTHPHPNPPLEGEGAACICALLTE